LACKTDKIDSLVLATLSHRDLVPAIWLVSKWQDGKSVWAKSFRDRAEALEAAGLEE
jgi:hypothetical protein